MSPALPLTVIATVTWHDMEAMAERLVDLATGGPGAASLLAARPWAAVSPFRSQSATAKQNEPFPHNRNQATAGPPRKPPAAKRAPRPLPG